MIITEDYLRIVRNISILIFTIQLSYGQNYETEVDLSHVNEEAITSNQVIEKIIKESDSNILVCAHRAFYRNAPENSLKSIKDAIEASIDIAEVDIRTTKDSILVLMHDDYIDRTTTGKGLLKDYTYSQLQEFNLKINDSVTSYKIPKLSDVLLLAKDKIILNLDLKNIEPFHFYMLLKSYDMEHKVISFIWNKETIEELIKIDATYAVLPLSENKKEMQLNLERYQSPLQHFTEKNYSFSNMDWANNNGVSVFINTLWDEDIDFINGNTHSLDSLLLLRPAIIQTDYPKLMVDYLKKKGLHD
ncbi:glycerophosphodiester phosphodiesterase family protein [Flaviramulus aquimarinus]|uniref:Glycerophosphodiester phosphodiesterase family protein n=1 Tax=Flaviramulus aquimarinus TaxID=1170456 RepID=A0ABP9F8S0_9FLAO